MSRLPNLCLTLAPKILVYSNFGLFIYQDNQPNVAMSTLAPISSVSRKRKRDEEKVLLGDPLVIQVLQPSTNQLLLLDSFANIYPFTQSLIYLQSLIHHLRLLLQSFSPESKYPSIGSRVCLHDSFQHIFLL